MPLRGQGAIGGPCNLTEAQVPRWIFILIRPQPFWMSLGQGLLIRLWIQGALKWISTVPLKVFLVPPSVVIAEVDLVVVQLCSFCCLVSLSQWSSCPRTGPPEGLAPSSVCSRPVWQCLSRAVKWEILQVATQKISVYLLGLDFYYVSECRNILCL